MCNAHKIKTVDDIAGIFSPFDNNFFIGHEQERSLLCSLINHKRQHHALLFEGQQGLGKASLALHLAYNLFNYQEDNEEFTIKAPVTESVIWRQMGQNIYPGFLYLTRSYDGNAKRFKSYIAAEEIKQIGRMLHHSVSDSGKRIIIIDNLGDLNQYSANALLKMLEEPPNNTLFILISHLHKPVLTTIRSRCFAIRFKPLTVEQLKTALPHCVQNAKEIDDFTIEQANGNIRKAALLYLSQASQIHVKLDKLLFEKPLNINAMQQIAEELVAKDQTIVYQQCIENLLYLIAKQAKEKANIASLKTANELCHIWRSISKDFHTTNLYNLNKKQLLCNAITKSFNLMHDK